MTEKEKELRQWYAGLAMEAIIRKVDTEGLGKVWMKPEHVAKLAWGYAEAMVNENKI